MKLPKAEQTKWYYLIDGIRGISLFNMLLFHFYYDLNIIFRHNPSWYNKPAVHIWQQYICISFLFISGISCHFSRNNLKRGIQLNLYGLLITIVTLIFLPSQVVWFGILNCIGCATLFICSFKKLKSFFLEKFHILPTKEKSKPKTAHSIFGFAISIILFLITRHISDGHLCIASKQIELPGYLYQIRPLTILGLPYPEFFSSDYFPIFPWFFILLAGYFFWDILSSSDKILNLLRTKIPFFSTIGKKTIWIYLLHQPILYVAAYLIDRYLTFI